MTKIFISRRTLTILAVLIPLVVLLAYVALRSGPLAPIAVTVLKVQERALRPAVFGVGNVMARQMHRIGPTAPGRLLRLHVDVGDKVKAGQVLGEMDPVDNDDRLKSQEATVKRTEAILEDLAARKAYAATQAQRYELLFAQQATSEEIMVARRQDLQIATAQLSVALEDRARAQSDMQALIKQRASLRLISPAEGVVTAREVEPGTTVVSGQAVVEVIDPKSLWVNARFDQISANGLAADLLGRIELRSARGQSTEGYVQRTELRADAVTEELLAKVSFKTVPYPLPPIGERAEVTIYLPALPHGPVIPNAAVHKQGKEVGVWVVNGETVAFMPVKLGRADLDGDVQVLDGIKTDDVVVLYSEKTLGEHSRVHVVKTLPGVTS